jgi:hypothetical protein
MHRPGTFLGTFGPAERENSRLAVENRKAGDAGESGVAILGPKRLDRAMAGT